MLDVHRQRRFSYHAQQVMLTAAALVLAARY